MFEIDLFNQEVINSFLKRKSEKDLSGLERASRAKLRDLFLMRLARGELEKDIPTLTEIFNPLGNYDTLGRAIRAGEDKFRPLQELMLERTSKPTDNVVKLLAILIDFQPRPYSLWQEKYRTREQSDDAADETPRQSFNKELTDDTEKLEDLESGKLIVEEGDMTEKEGRDVDRKKGIEGNKALIGADEITTRPKKNRRQFYLLGGLVLIIVLVYATYTLQSKQCMCWNEDHYIEVDCKDRATPCKAIALNKEKLDHFRKITRPDTLSITDVNRVWYSKIDNKVEFFTAPGLHPVHDHRSLKAATKHIIALYAMGRSKESLKQ